MHDARSATLRPQEVEQIVKSFGAGEDLDALSLLEAVARLLPDHAGVVFCTFLGDGRGRNPKLPDLDPVGALILTGVVEPEKLTRTFDVIGVEVGDADDIEIIPIRVIEVPAQFASEVNALVKGVLEVARVGKVDQNLASAGQVEPATISIPKWEKCNFCSHSSLPSRRASGSATRVFNPPPDELPTWEHDKYVYSEHGGTLAGSQVFAILLV